MGAISADVSDFDNGYIVLTNEKRCIKASKYSLDGKQDAKPSRVISAGLCNVKGENEFFLRLSCSHDGKRGFMMYAKELSDCRQALNQ